LLFDGKVATLSPLRKPHIVSRRAHLLDHTPTGSFDVGGNHFGRATGVLSLEASDQLAMFLEDCGTPPKRYREAATDGP
jgi:hypothetical protein